MMRNAAARERERIRNEKSMEEKSFFKVNLRTSSNVAIYRRESGLGEEVC
jgi:hypothetical protein